MSIYFLTSAEGAGPVFGFQASSVSRKGCPRFGGGVTTVSPKHIAVAGCLPLRIGPAANVQTNQNPPSQTLILIKVAYSAGPLVRNTYFSGGSNLIAAAMGS